jgi:hypothetical protein
MTEAWNSYKYQEYYFILANNTYDLSQLSSLAANAGENSSKVESECK